MAQDMMAMLQALLGGGGGAPPVGGAGNAMGGTDPRIAALAQLSSGNENPMMRGVMDPQQMMQQRRAPPMLDPEYQPERRPYQGKEILEFPTPPRDPYDPMRRMDSGEPPYTTPSPENMDRRIEQGRSNKTTEQELQDVHDQMDYMAGDHPDDDQDEWPETPEEFKLKYGRAPATDSEVEFYYGPEQGETPKSDSFFRTQERTRGMKPSEARRGQDPNLDGDDADEEDQYNKKRNLR